MAETASQIPASKQPRFALWLFVVTFCLRLLELCLFSTTPYFWPNGGDMHFYHAWALRLLQGEWTHGAFYGLPGYAWWLAGIYKVVGVHPFAATLLQCVSEGLVAVVIFKLAQTIFRDERADAEPLTAAAQSAKRTRSPELIGVAAALAWAFYQPAASFSIVLMPTTFLVLAYWGCVFWILRMRKNPPLWQWLLLGLTAGAVSMMIATILMLIPLFVFAAAWRGWRREMCWGKSLIAIVLIFAGIFIGMSPCWIHNYFVARQPVLLSAHDGVNFYIGNNAIANGYPKLPPGMSASQTGMLRDSITIAERAAGHPLTKVEVSKYWSAKAKAFIHEEPLAWIKLLGVKFKNFWNAYQYDDLSLIPLLSESGVIPPGLRFGVISLTAIAGIFFVGWRFRRARWVIGGIALHLASLMPVFITERYRLAAVPGLLLMSCGGLWMLWRWLVLRQWKPVVAYGALTAAAFFFVTQPPLDRTFWALDPYNVGIAILNANSDAHDLALAQRKLETAYAFSPNDAEINFALGNLWLKKGDSIRARGFYFRALELEPTMGSGWKNLGIIALNEKRWPLAERFFTAAIRCSPDDVKSLYLLAKSQWKQKHLPQAQATLQRALKMQPRDPDCLHLQQEILTSQPAHVR